MRKWIDDRFAQRFSDTEQTRCALGQRVLHSYRGAIATHRLEFFGYVYGGGVEDDSNRQTQISGELMTVWQQVYQPRACIILEATLVPESVGSNNQPRHRFIASCFERPLESGAQVVLFEFQACKPH